MSNIKLGQFIYDNSTIHRLDPRTKLIGCSLLILSTLINSNWYFLIAYSTLITLGIVLANLKIRKVYKSLRKLRWLLLLTFIFQAFLTDGQPVLLIGKFHLTKEGVMLGTTTIIRLSIIYLSSTLLTVSTSPIKLATGIEAILLPLRHLKLPVQQLAMIIGTSLRFVPTFIEEADILTRAQQSRGAQFNAKKSLIRFKALLAVIIPLLAASLQRANDLAIAMESRCYVGNSNHIRLRNLRFSRLDMFTSLLIFLVFISSIVNKILI